MSRRERHVDEIERVAESLWRADVGMTDERGLRWPSLSAGHYRGLARVAIAALGVREEQYRSAQCPDQLDYDMVRWCSNWRPVKEEG